MANPVIESFEFGLAGGTTATSVTANKPASVATGDLLILLCSIGNNTNTSPFPTKAGWTKQFEFGNSTYDVHIGCYTRIADETEGATETVTYTNGTDSGILWYLRVTGHNPTTYWNILGTEIGAGNNPVTPSVTPTVDECLVFGMYGSDGNISAMTPSGTNWPSSFPTDQEKHDGTADFDGVTSGWVTQAQTTAAASNDLTFTATGADGSYAVQFAIAPATASPEVTDINTDEIVLDNEQNATFTTTGFSGEITTVKLKSGTAISNASGVTSASGAGTFDAPDITSIATSTAGCPFSHDSSGTSLGHTVEFELSDGTDTGTLAGSFRPKAGYEAVAASSVLNVAGSVSENFVGAVPDGSLCYYPTANNTSVDAQFIITTDSTVNIDMWYWDATLETWDTFEAILLDIDAATLTDKGNIGLNLGTSL